MGRDKNDDQDDKIVDLPDESDDDVPPKELAILNSILDMKKNSPAHYAILKPVIYAALIFLVMSLPFTDRILEIAMPAATSWLILVGLKTVAFFVLYYIVMYVCK